MDRLDWSTALSCAGLVPGCPRLAVARSAGSDVARHPLAARAPGPAPNRAAD